MEGSRGCGYRHHHKVMPFTGGTSEIRLKDDVSLVDHKGRKVEIRAVTAHCPLHESNLAYSYHRPIGACCVSVVGTVFSEKHYNDTKYTLATQRLLHWA